MSDFEVGGEYKLTGSGQPAKILVKYGDLFYGLNLVTKEPLGWNAKGEALIHFSSYNNLVKPKKKLIGWVNLYTTGMGAVFKNENFALGCSNTDTYIRTERLEFEV